MNLGRPEARNGHARAPTPPPGPFGCMLTVQLGLSGGCLVLTSDV
jgi:hypothetical protein